MENAKYERFKKAQLAYNKYMQAHERRIMSGKSPTHVSEIKKTDERIRKLKVKMDKAQCEWLGRNYVPDYKDQDRGE